MTITIDKEKHKLVPFNRGQGKYKEHFQKLELGMSFTVPKELSGSVRSSFNIWAQHNKLMWKLAIRKTDDPNIYRCWVIEKK